MQEKREPYQKFEQLRREAEMLIKRSPDDTPSPPTDMLHLIHELRVFQTELEIQNEELKQTQQGLVDLHCEFEDLYEFAPCGYMTINSKGTIRRINLRGVALLGADRERLYLKSLSSFISPDWKEGYWAALKLSGERGEKQSLELRLQREKGAAIWVRADILADRDEDGGVKQWRLALIDITEEKKAREAEKQSEKKFRALFQNAPIAYQSLDENGDFIEVNQAWLDILGYSRDEVIGNNFATFIHPDWQAHFMEKFPRFKAVGEVLGVEFVMCKKDGTEILVSFHGKISTNPDGSFQQTHCAFHDITDLRKAEEEKKALEEQLKQSQKVLAIGTLAGGIAHDFNNILSIILGNAEMAVWDLPEVNPARVNLKEIKQAALRGKDVTTQLLSFARKSQKGKKALDLSETVKECLRLLLATLPSNIEIQKELSPSAGMVLADPTQIHQIMINLCTNAADSMGETGRDLTVRVDGKVLAEGICPHHPDLKPGKYVRLVVADDGMGMDQQTLERIFDPYYTTKALGKGTGLGLSVVHGIVKGHGGSIFVHSEPGKGASFEILFPEIQREQAAGEPPVEAPPTGTERVLFVDDEPSVAALGEKMLKKLGYGVTAFTDSREALQAFEIQPEAFDLVISDMTMPGMTGDILARKVMGIRPDIPVIICTGYSARMDEDQARELGIAAYSMKPFVLEKIAKTIRNVLDGE